MLNCMSVCRQISHFRTTSNTKIPIRVFCFMLPIFGNERSVINSYLQCLRPGTRTTWGVHPVCLDWLQQTCSLIARQQEGGPQHWRFLPPLPLAVSQSDLIRNSYQMISHAVTGDELVLLCSCHVRNRIFIIGADMISILGRWKQVLTSAYTSL